MAGGMEMFARMLMWAGIAAPDVAACQAHPQVCPRVFTELVAPLAFARRVGLRLDQGLRDGGKVFACIGDRWGVGVVPA
jgi:hypothetical protein